MSATLAHVVARTAAEARGADLRLAVPALAAWVAAFFAVGGLPGWMAVGLWAAAVLLLGASFRWVPSLRAAATVTAVSLAAAALLCTITIAREPARYPAQLEAVAGSGRSTVVLADTTGPVVDGRVPARIAGAPVLLFLDEQSGAWGIGATLELRGAFVKTDRGDDVSYLVFVTGEAVQRAPPPSYLGWSNSLRDRFAAEAATLPGDGGDLLPGLAIGDTSAIGESLDLAMKASSLSHLTAVSGANCAVVVGLIMAVGAALGWRRGLRVVASVLVLVGFVVLVTPEPSVLRAALMATLVLVALASARPVRGVPVLALAVIALLVSDPWLSRDYGFVLSVLATGALLVLAAPLARFLNRWMPLPLATVIAVPLAAQLVCQPVLLLLNSTIPVFGVGANLLAEPAAPLATVLGLLACVTLPVVPWLGEALALLAWVPASWIAAVARFFPSLPGAQVPWPAGAPGVLLLIALTALSLLAMLGAARRRRIVAALLALTLGASVGAAALGTRITGELTRPDDWQIAACDIGQGDAVLVRSAGRVALIDTGPDPALLTECLDTLGIGRIDLLVLTHFDLDHVGGTDAVLGRVDQALVGPTDGADDVRLRESLRQAGAVVRQGSRGMTALLGDLRWSLLWPRYPTGGIPPGNDASLVMRFEPAGLCANGCLSSLFLGDLGESSQSLVLASGDVEEVDVVKVAHHGSADQSETMYSEASAALGIIGVGGDNTYGHPTDRALELLEAAGTTVVRTDRDGLVLVSAQRASGGNSLSLSVWSSGGRGVEPRDGARR